MIQTLRYLILLAQRPWVKRRSPLRISQNTFHVMPWDCDLNFHLTNGRYPVWLDLVRTRFFIEIGASRLFLKHGWRSVLASQTVTFIREIQPLTKVQVISEVLCWDRKYLYLEHKFMVNGQLHASALARVAVLHGGSVRSFSAMLEAIHGSNSYHTPDMPPQIQAQVDLLNAKKQAAVLKCNPTDT